MHASKERRDVRGEESRHGGALAARLGTGDPSPRLRQAIGWSEQLVTTCFLEELGPAALGKESLALADPAIVIHVVSVAISMVVGG